MSTNRWTIHLGKCYIVYRYHITTERNTIFEVVHFENRTPKRPEVGLGDEVGPQNGPKPLIEVKNQTIKRLEYTERINSSECIATN